MPLSLFMQFLMLLLAEPLVLKSGTILECESIVKRGEWVVVVLSETDERYKPSGKSNKFKIKTEKVDWNKTAREMKLRANRSQPENPTEKAPRKPISLDQKGLAKYHTPDTPDPVETPQAEPLAPPETEKAQDPRLKSQEDLNQNFQEKYDAMQFEIKALDTEIANLEQSIVWEDPDEAPVSNSIEEKNLEIEAEINRKMRRIETLKQESVQIKTDARKAGAKLRLHKKY